MTTRKALPIHLILLPGLLIVVGCAQKDQPKQPSFSDKQQLEKQADQIIAELLSPEEKALQEKIRKQEEMPLPMVPKDRASILAELDRFNADIETEGNKPDGAVIKVALENSNVMNSTLAYLAGLPDLQELVIDHPSITDRGLEALRPLQKLRSFKLVEGIERVTDKGLQHLTELKNLEELELSGTKKLTEQGIESFLKQSKNLKSLKLAMLNIGGKALAPLADHPNLVSLDLSVCKKIPDLSPLPKNKKLARLVFAFSAITDDDMQIVGKLTGLRELSLFGTGISDTGLTNLGTLTNLEILNVAECKAISSKGLQVLANMPRLRILNLSKTKMSDQDLDLLKGLSHLTDLGLQSTKITDMAMEHLVKFPGLEGLDLAQTKITDAGLKALAQLKNLRALDLSSTAVGDDGMVHIAKLTNLRNLLIPSTKVTDSGLVHLKNLSNLQSLYLNGPGITDKGFAEIVALPALREIAVRGTKVTPEKIKEIKQAKPKLSVF